MKKLAAKLWAVLMLMLVSMQTMATDVFTSNRTDFRDESIYFMMTTRFYDGDPSNNVLCWDNQEAQKSTKDPCWRGDFQGVIDKLDYIKALGFTAIWITPVVQNASGYDYHGYHASDFSKVDCRYQSGDGKKSGDVMFQELIDKAHAKGIKIILDIVLNHTGNFGEEHFCKEFDRDTRLRNQADINACMIPNLETLGSDYPGLQPGYQYQRRLAMMKNTDGQNHDPHNYWHHFGNFNWTYLIVGGLRLQATVWTSILRIIQWLIILSSAMAISSRWVSMVSVLIHPVTSHVLPSASSSFLSLLPSVRSTRTSD